jgi:hypothetical protein
VAPLALSDISVPGFSPHGVLGSELVPVVAMGTGSLVMDSVVDLVEIISGIRSVFDVFGSAVELVPVEMSSDKPFGSWAKKNHGHQIMDFESLFGSVTSIKNDYGIPFVVQTRLENFSRCLLAEGKNVASCVNSISIKSRDTNPMIISHGVTLHQAKQHVKEGFSDGR